MTTDEQLDYVTYWILVADGINHDHRCPNHFAGNKDGDPCLRCQLEASEVLIKAQIAQLKAKLPGLE